MKTFIAALLMVCSSAFAQELDATEALLSILPHGEYRGSTPEGERCQISVKNLSNKVAIIASQNGKTKRSEVESGVNYLFNPGNRLFSTSALTTTLSGSREDIIRTLAVTERTQYVVVADLNIENRRVNETKIECIVDL